MKNNFIGEWVLVCAYSFTLVVIMYFVIRSSGEEKHEIQYKPKKINEWNQEQMEERVSLNTL